MGRNRAAASYAAAHFLVDFACAFGMLRFVRSTPDWHAALLFYNFFAFAGQMPLGLLADRFGNGRLFAAAGCLLTAAAYLLAGAPGLFAVCAGAGNALFHIGGGYDTLARSGDRAGRLGVFVSPGALGLFLGALLGKGTLSPLLPPALLLVPGLALPLLCERTPGEGPTADRAGLAPLAALFLVGIANPLLDRTPVLVLGGIPVSGGTLSLITLFLKGTFAVLASYLLIATATIEEICYSLRLLRLPRLLVTVVMLTYRYILLFMQEARRMSLACSLRCPGERGVPVSLWGALAGQMLLRAVDRGERVYGSMTLRGFHGEFPPPARRPARGGVLWFAFWCLALAVLRAVPVFELVGRLL